MFLIDLAQRDVARCGLPAYLADRRLADAVAFRVMHIGENTIHLSAAIKSRHPALPWRDMAATRHVLAHDYARINDGLIHSVVVHHLDHVRTMCLAELDAAKNQGE